MRGAARAFALAAIALAVLGCGDTPAPGSPAGRPTIGVPTSAPLPSDAPATSNSQQPSAGSTVLADDTLLAILPPELDGVAVTAEPLAFDEATGDPDFVASVQAAAFPVAAGPADLASGVVARLRAGVFDDDFFRGWRTAYDEGACAQAGGVVGRAEAELGGRTVHITSCAEGLRVYHAYLPELNVLVSLFSLGDARFGERLMEGLRP